MKNLYLYKNASLASVGLSSREVAAAVRANLSGQCEYIWQDMRGNKMSLHYLADKYLYPIPEQISKYEAISLRSERSLQLAGTALLNDFEPFSV
jgi:hypothetical protein